MEKTTVKNITILANNQIIIRLTNGIKIFNSYGKNIVEVSDVIKLDENYWAYSYTTSKYRCQFLCELKTETEKKIKSGEYILTNLN